MDKKHILYALALVGVFCLGYYAMPTKTVTHQQIIRDTHIIKRPDGTVETVIKDRSHTETVKQKGATTPPWSVTVMLDAPDFRPNTLLLQRRILGPLEAGIWVNTDKAFGIAVTLRF